MDNNVDGKKPDSITYEDFHITAFSHIGDKKVEELGPAMDLMRVISQNPVSMMLPLFDILNTLKTTTNVPDFNYQDAMLLYSIREIMFGHMFMLFVDKYKDKRMSDRRRSIAARKESDNLSKRVFKMTVPVNQIERLFSMIYEDENAFYEMIKTTSIEDYDVFLNEAFETRFIKNVHRLMK